MDFKTIKERLNTQNNRATADPIFVVYDYERVPSCEDYTETWEYIDEEGDYIGKSKEELMGLIKDKTVEVPLTDTFEDMDSDELLEYINESGGYEFRKFYYIKKKVFINVFFTEKSADDFIKQNDYHYTKEVHTYVNCLWRNPEMQFIREMIMSGKLDEITGA